jgi:hypothetical protein
MYYSPKATELKNPMTEPPIDDCKVSSTKPISSTIIAYSMTVAPERSRHNLVAWIPIRRNILRNPGACREVCAG